MEPPSHRPIIPVNWLNEGNYQLYAEKDSQFAIVNAYIMHGRGWKIWQGIQAIAFAIFTAGIGVKTDFFRNKWNQTQTGKEKVSVVERMPAHAPTTTAHRVHQLSSKKLLHLEPLQEKKLEILLWLDQFKRTNEFPANLESGFDMAYVARDLVTEQEDQNAMLKIAQELFKQTENSNALAFLLHVDELNRSLANASTISDLEERTRLLEFAEWTAQEFIKIRDFERALAIRMNVAKCIAISSPLAELKGRLAKEDSKLGFRLYPIDTSLFKNHVLAMQTRTFTDGSSGIHLEAKLNHPAHAGLEKTLTLLRENRDLLEKGLPKGFCSGIGVEIKDDVYLARADKIDEKYGGAFIKDKRSGYKVERFGAASKNIVIDFKSVGKVQIGFDKGFLTQYDRIAIDLDPGIKEEEAAAKINIMLAVLGLEAVSASPRKEDEERIKVLQLFRIFYPREAYGIERDEMSFREPLSSLKTRIEKAVPEMKARLHYYLHDHPELMYKQEVYPGQSVWAVRGLSEEVKANGGIGLMANMMGSSFADSVERLASMLKIGALSTQDRFQIGVIAQGYSAVEDLARGGGEYVFTRLITKNMPTDPTAYAAISGNFQLLFDLRLVERVGLNYAHDAFGSKAPNLYASRPSILELTKLLMSAESEDFLANEVCIHNRVPPEFIKGVVLSTIKEKEEMIKILRSKGLIKMGAGGKECINGVPIDKFIHIGEFKEEYWA